MELQEAEQKQRSMKELERKFCVAQSTVAGIISRLEQKGFVEAFGDASDTMALYLRSLGIEDGAEQARARKEVNPLLRSD